MHRIVLFVWIVALGLAPSVARAQVFGQFTGGSVLPMERNAIGGYGELSSNLFGLIGQIRGSFQPKTDFGFQGGVGVYDQGGADVTSVRLGADFRVLARPRDELLRVDLTAGAAIGVETGDDLNILRLGPSIVASRPFGGTPEDPRFRPYAGFELLFSREQVRDLNRSGMSMPIHVGSEWRLTRGLQLDAELQWRVGNQFGDNAAFSTGLTSVF